ncbi:MAG: CHASE2 domain-containing protein [Halothece sp.]
MSQLVILNLGRGSLQKGFPVITASIYRKNQADPQQCISHFTGSLPAAPQLLTLYRRWQSLYESLYRMRIISIRQTKEKEDDGLEIDESDVTHISEGDFANLATELQDLLNRWLDTEGFRYLERQLRMHFHPNEEVCIIIQTEDMTLPRIPWFSWQFLQDYSYAEVAFSGLNFQSRTSPPSTNQPLRILAILGDATGINVERDRALLENLPQAEVSFLVEPSRKVFNDYLWAEKGWYKILFFAGHSTTDPAEMTGRIYLNSEESLTISQLNYGLNRAIAQGLQLAIFNSCDGLGLAQQLTEINLPQTIVMREPVSDRVAQEFLKYFLTAFARGDSFFRAAREAREQLQGLEGEFPGASWLPLIFQNPSTVPLMWPKAKAKIPSLSQGKRLKFSYLLFMSGMVSAVVMGIRWLGLLQPLELSAYDTFMGLRPQQGQSDKILLVTIDSKDMAFQDEQEMPRQGSLSDEALAKLLEKITPYQPVAIGLDIYRHPPISDLESKAKVDRWREQDLLVDICQIGGRGGESEVLPPPRADLSHVGFSDLPIDPDLVIRRQIFGMAPGNPDGCYTTESFSFLLAKRYLATEGIEPQRISDDQFEIGSAVFSKVDPPAGGYQSIDSGGFEVLLNYHGSGEIAPTIPLREILDGSREEELGNLLRDRVILVGNIDPSFKDYHQTPYAPGKQGLEEMAGVKIQAHATAAIISAALGEPPTLWWLPQWGDFILVLSWGMAGGMIVYFKRDYRFLIVTGGTLLVLLTGGYWLVFWQWGGWLPLLPSFLAVSFTGVMVIFLPKWL